MQNVRLICAAIACTMFQTATAQPAPDLSQLSVSRVPVDDISTLPEEAIEPSIDANATSNVAEFEIVGVDVVDSANRPGREDDRDRVLHHGRDVKFFETENRQTLPAPRLRPDWMLSHHINVGQGNATLLEFSCGVVLIDTGGEVNRGFDGRRSLVDYLNSVFARRPDLHRRLAAVYLTHPHEDHAAGVLTLLAANPAISIGSVIVNGRTNGSGWTEQRRLLRHAEAREIPVTIVTNESIRRSDGLTNNAIDPVACATVDPDIRVLWGSDSSAHSWAEEANNHSVVIRVDFGESSFLFTGDLEEDAQPEFIGSYVRNPDILDADVYQVSHHGSRNGTTVGLLRAMSPEIAVIGSGDPAVDNGGQFSAYNHGHPNRATIALLTNGEYGVSMSRPAVTVPVGIVGRRPNPPAPPRFGYESIDRAIFATGWDGHIVIAASSTGQKVVQTR